jgi:hypothetical protein
MAGFSTANNEHLIRSDVWTRQIDKNLQDRLLGTRYVRMIQDFPDGDTLNMPSIGDMTSADYVENQAVTYTAMDTGNFEFSITDYIQSGTYITNKMKQDTYYMNELISMFVPEMNRAIAKRMETDIWKKYATGQTAASTNAINSIPHRWIGQGTNETMSVLDFQRARLALHTANVPLENLVAIVDPTVEYALATQTNLVNFNCNPRWEGIVKTGLSNGLNFITNIFGFDVYTSNYLHKNTATENIGTPTTAVGAVNNVFFNAEHSLLPVVGAIRQPPKVDSKYNQDFQREEYVTTCRWGFKWHRPQNTVVVVTDVDQV